MNIGEPTRTWTVEPIVDPVPRELPERDTPAAPPVEEPEPVGS